MKKLVVFKRRPQEQERPKASPKPVREAVFNPDDVPSPPAKRKLSKFRERREFVMIVQYRPGLRKDSDYQKLGFKVDGGYPEAALEAEKLARMIGKAVAVDLHEIRKEELCRVLAVYEVSAFRDWESENVVEASASRRHTMDALKQMKKETAPISYVKDVKVRG